MQVRIMCKLGMWGRETIRLTSANDGIRHCGEATLHLLQQVLYLSFPTEATPMIHVVILLGDSGGGGGCGALWQCGAWQKGRLGARTKMVKSWVLCGAASSSIDASAGVAATAFSACGWNEH